MDITVVNAVTKTIGSLALSYPYLRRLGFADLIDDLTTKGKEREVSTGRVIEVLVWNRLSLRPSPISKIYAWARGQVIEEVYGVAADALNDDRIGRALDEIYPHLTDAWAALVMKGIQTYQPRRIASLVFVVMVALFVLALIEREARRVVAESREVFRSVRPGGRDHLPITTPVLFEAFASLTLLVQRLRVGDEIHDLVVPTSLTGVQLAILDTLRRSPLHTRKRVPGGVPTPLAIAMERGGG